MKFNEICSFVDSENERLGTLLDKYIMYAESVLSEYRTNIKEAEIKVVLESGTSDDYCYLVTEAQKGVGDRIAKSIKSAFDSVIEFIQKIIEKIKEFFTKDAKNSMAELEKKLKDAPDVAKITIEIPNIKDIEKVQKKADHQIKSILPKIRKSTSEEIDKLGDAIDYYIADPKKEEKKQNAVKIGAVVVGVAAGIGISKGVLNNLDSIKQNASKVNDEIKKKMAETMSPEDSSKFLQFANKATSLYRKQTMELHDWWIETIGAIKRAFNGMQVMDNPRDLLKKKKNVEKDDVKEESVADVNNMSDEELDNYLESVINDVQSFDKWDADLNSIVSILKD